MSSVGKKYKRETAAYLAQGYPKELATLKPNTGYLLKVRFRFTDLENKTWPTSAKTRYKRIDASNRLKLLEDVIAEVSGIDDSQNLTVVLEKIQGIEECTEVWIWDLDADHQVFTRVFSV